MSNNSPEMFAVFNDKGVRIGEADRNVVHNFGLWHATFVCMVYERHRKKILCQVKADHKPADNNDFEIDFSAGGHIRADEDPSTSHRELEEELGAPISEYTMHFLGQRQSAGTVQLGRIENEWQYLWLAIIDDKELEKLHPNEESRGLIELDPSDTIALLSGKKDFIKAAFHQKNMPEKNIQITRDNFVPAYINGEKIFLRLFESVLRYEYGEETLRW